MKFRIGVAALAAAALVAAGCGGDDDNQTASAGGTTTSHESMSHSSSTGPSKGVDTPASALRASLTAGLQEHVYLAGIAVENGVAHGLDSAQFKAAAGTLDRN